MKSLIIIILTLFSFKSFSDDIFVIVVQKQEAKKAAGWSLSDWMMTKQTMALQDQWLALNTSSNLFEFFLSVESGDYDLERSGLSPLKQIKGGDLGAYVSIFGLEYERSYTNEAFNENDLRFSLRLLGRQVQGTNVSFHYGQKTKEFDGAGTLYQNDEFKNKYIGASVTLYLLPFLGAKYVWHKYNDNDSKNGRHVDGELSELTGFLDISFLQFYMTFSKEILDVRPSGGTLNREKRDGTRLGLRLYF